MDLTPSKKTWNIYRKIYYGVVEGDTVLQLTDDFAQIATGKFTYDGIKVLLADKETICLPPLDMTNKVELEGEVALVIGKNGKNIKEEDALSHVFGYTVYNDVTARDLTKSDPQFTRGKGFDTFGPIGPWVVTGVDPSNLRIVTTLNGKIVQDGNTNEIISG